MIWPAARCHLSAAALFLSEPLLTLTSAGPWFMVPFKPISQEKKEKKRKRREKSGAAGCRVCLQPPGHLHSVRIDNQTVNRVVSNNRLIMNCK